MIQSRSIYETSQTDIRMKTIFQFVPLFWVIVENKDSDSFVTKK